jgi:hypothetical protein
MPFWRDSRKRSAGHMGGGCSMANIKLPRVLTPPVLRAVRDNVERLFQEWVVAERRKAPAAIQTGLQAAYERANATYHEVMDRAAQEGVPLDGS